MVSSHSIKDDNFLLKNFFFIQVQCKQQQPNPYLVAVACHNEINQEFHNEFNEMIRIIKKNVEPEINKQIIKFVQQPAYNYANYFKHDIDFTAQFVISRIERAFEQTNFDHFFNVIKNCTICEKRNITSVDCLGDGEFKHRFVNESLSLFDEYPIGISRQKDEKIDKFKKEHDLEILKNSYSHLLTIFNESRYIELKMQNMIKDRLIDCCSKPTKLHKIDL